MHIGTVVRALLRRVQLGRTHNRVRLEGLAQRDDARAAHQRKFTQQTRETTRALVVLLLSQSQARVVRRVHHKQRSVHILV